MVSVLFARQDSIYKTLPDCDVWDIERDALKWTGGNPIVAHPPCRAWGQLSHFAKPRDGEKELAVWAVDQIRTWGGVLEHPARSKLWPALKLPLPGRRDDFEGFSVRQHCCISSAVSRLICPRSPLYSGSQRTSLVLW